MWLLLAFSGPVCWAVSTHIDKYLVDRYFRDSDTAVLMLFTAFLGVVLLPLIWWIEPGILKPSPHGDRGDDGVGHPLYGRDAVLSARHPERGSLGGGAAVPGLHPVHVSLGCLFLHERLGCLQLLGVRPDRGGRAGPVAAQRGSSFGEFKGRLGRY